MFRCALALVLLCAPAVRGQEAAPRLALRDLRGRTVRLGDYRGKVVLLNFWAMWCPPCRAEIPELVKWQRAYAARGLQVVGVTYPPEDARAVRRLARALRVNYPILFGTRRTASLFAVGEILPVTLVIDREVQLRERILGILEPEEFEEKIKPLLR